MRITNKIITGKYIKQVNSMATDLYKLNAKVSSGRAFSKASENTSAAIRAFQVRREMASTEGYNSNIMHAESTLTNSESSITHMQELVQNAKVKILQGTNGTQSLEERKIIATELRNVQDQLLQTLNSNSSDMYLFGGSNTDIKPFSATAGRLQYNGQDLDALTPAAAKLLEEDSRYIDIGLNVKMDPLTGVIDRNTVFNYSIPGIKIIGSGTSLVGATTVSNNIYNLLGDLATSFEDPNYDSSKVRDLASHLDKVSGSIVSSLTEVGAKTSYLEFVTKRLDTKNLNDIEKQSKIEGADPAETIIHFKSQEAAYNAALQMGTKIIQPSIFNFMN